MNKHCKGRAECGPASEVRTHPLDLEGTTAWGARRPPSCGATSASLADGPFAALQMRTTWTPLTNSCPTSMNANSPATRRATVRVANSHLAPMTRLRRPSPVRGLADDYCPNLKTIFDLGRSPSLLRASSANSGEEGVQR